MTLFEIGQELVIDDFDGFKKDTVKAIHITKKGVTYEFENELRSFSPEDLYFTIEEYYDVKIANAEAYLTKLRKDKEDACLKNIL